MMQALKALQALSAGNSSKIATKLVFKQYVRRFSFSDSSSFAELVQQVHARFGLTGSVSLSYKHGERAICTICCDEDLAEARRLAWLAVPPVLRVQVDEPFVATTRAPTETPSATTTSYADVSSRSRTNSTDDTELQQESFAVRALGKSSPIPSARVLSFATEGGIGSFMCAGSEAGCQSR